MQRYRAGSWTGFGVLLTLGLWARLFQFLVNRSLWVDEAAVALNLMRRSYLQLTEPLEYVQAAPIGFLWTIKSLIFFLGDSEMALRFFPLLTGILSIPVFFYVSQHFMPFNWSLVTTGVFSILDPLIYFSTELKPYSSDVLIALSLILCYLSWTPRNFKGISSKRLIALAVFGGLAIWLSYPSIFILATIGTLFLLDLRKNSGKRELALFLSAILFWVANFSITYGISTIHATKETKLVNFHSAYFMPLPPRSLADIDWIKDVFLEAMEIPGGYNFAYLALILFIVGCVSLFKDHLKRSLLLTGPFFLVLLASGVKKYPFFERLILFLSPFMLLAIMVGILAIGGAVRRRPIYGNSIIALLTLFTFLGPISKAAQAAHVPKYREEIKLLLHDLKQELQDEDTIFVYYGAAMQYLYYRDRMGFRDVPSHITNNSRGNFSDYVANINLLSGKQRVWVIFSHRKRVNGVQEWDFFKEHLDKIGTEIKRKDYPGCRLHLYNFIGQSRN